MSKRGREEEEEEEDCCPEEDLVRKQYQYQYLRSSLLIRTSTSADRVRLAVIDNEPLLDRFTKLLQINDPRAAIRLLEEEKFIQSPEVLVRRAAYKDSLVALEYLLKRFPEHIDFAIKSIIEWPPCDPKTMTFALATKAEKTNTALKKVAADTFASMGQDVLRFDSNKIRVLCELAETKTPTDQDKERKENPPPPPQPLIKDEEDEMLVTHKEEAHNAEIFDVKFSPDGKYVATSAYYSQAKVWRTSDWALVQEFRPVGRDSACSCVAFSPDSQTLYTASNHRTITEWRIGTVAPVRTFEVPSRRFVSKMTVSPDGRFLVTGDETRGAQVFDLQQTRSVKSTDLSSSCHHISFSRDGSRVFIVDENSIVVLVAPEWQDSRLSPSRYPGYASPSPVAPILAFTSGESTLVLFNYETKESKYLQCDWKGSLTEGQCHFSPDGRIVYVACRGGRIEVFDVASEKHLYRHTIYISPKSSAMSLTSQGLLVAVKGLQLYVYDLEQSIVLGRLKTIVSSGLVNSSRPANAWDVFLTRGLYDPRLALFIANMVGFTP